MFGHSSRNCVPRRRFRCHGALLGMAACLAAGWGVPAARAEEAPARPRMILDQSEVDLGIREPGPKAQFVLKLKNTGNAPLELISVKTNCGCVVASYDKEIRPGGTGTVLASLDTSALRGMVTKQLTVVSNDPDSPTVAVELKVTLRHNIEIAPAQGLHVFFRKGKVEEQVAVVHSFEKTPLKILKVQSGAPYVKAAALPGDIEADMAGMRSIWRQAVRVQVLPGAPARDFTIPVTIFTNSKKYPRVVLAVHGEPEGAVQALPPKIYFGEVTAKPREPVVRSIVLMTKMGAMAKKDGTARLLGTELKDPALKLHVLQDGAARFCEIVVRYEGGWKPGPVKGTLVLKTADPQRPRIEVPYSAEVVE